MTSVYTGSILEYCIKQNDLDSLNIIFTKNSMQDSDYYLQLLELSFKYETPMITKRIIELQFLPKKYSYETEIDNLTLQNNNYLESEQKLSKKYGILENNNIRLVGRVRRLEKNNNLLIYADIFIILIVGLYCMF
jgi:hypothetical protein